MAFESPRRLTSSANVVAQATASGAVLLDKATGECFELNRTGAEIWSQIAEGMEPAQIVRSIADRYDISSEQASADLLSLLDQFLSRGIVKYCP